VALSTANRKLLWARSGGFCAICKGLLTEDAATSDPAVVTGMEAHIVSAKVDGPRYRPIPPEDVDDPDNLILLCPTDHTIVDKQKSHYREDELRRIKGEHEAWVRRIGSTTPPQVRIRDPQKGMPMIVHRVATGAQLMNASGGMEAMQTSQPDRLSAEEVELVADFLQNIFDWSELWDEIGPGERVRVEHGITGDLDELLEAGFVVYAGTRPQVLEGGIGGRASWNLAVVIVFRVDDGEIRDERLVLPF
jgi:hypothetical protein